eukprot:COSAG01_NODE_1711_length_9416_cov_5.847912_9_plen_109_part_00
MVGVRFDVALRWRYVAGRLGVGTGPSDCLSRTSTQLAGTHGQGWEETVKVLFVSCAAAGALLELPPPRLNWCRLGWNSPCATSVFCYANEQPDGLGQAATATRRARLS